MRYLFFLIPVISRMLSKDWPEVERNLDATLRSILQSPSDRVRAVVCHHERPDVPALKDPRVTALEVDFARQDDVLKGSRDKQAKRRFGAAWLRENHGDCAIFFLDADDLVHRDLPDYILSKTVDAFQVETGYRWDEGRNALEPVNKNFSTRCGSCFGAFFTKAELPLSSDDMANTFSQIAKVKHALHAEVAVTQGKTCAPVPFPAIVYRINHASSLRAAKLIASQESLDGKRDTNPKKVLAPIEAVRILREDFAATSLPTLQDIELAGR